MLMRDTDKKEPYFIGKVVSFSTSESTLAINNPKFEKQKNRLFVVGSVPKGATKNNWAESRPCAIAWDAVVDYMVFDSIEQYNESLLKSEES
jgi:hypothetical protein